MNKKTNAIIAVISCVLTVVAIFVLFATCFKAGDYGSEYGTVFGVMFGSNTSYKAVPLMIVAFSVYCLAFVTVIAAALLNGKTSMIVFIATAALLIFAGIVFLLSPTLFRAVNPASVGQDDSKDLILQLGAGPITSAVFAFLSGAMCLFGAYNASK